MTNLDKSVWAEALKKQRARNRIWALQFALRIALHLTLAALAWATVTAILIWMIG